MPKVMLPDHRPIVDAGQVRELMVDTILADPHCEGAALLAEHQVIIVADRGHFANTLGRPGVNDQGYYDDAAFIVEPFGVHAFNFNTDPGRLGPSSLAKGKNYPVLVAGRVYTVRLGPHKGKAGFARQLVRAEAHLAELPDLFSDKRADGYFEVDRIGSDGSHHLEWDYQAINVHEGGDQSTFSAGCQTVPPVQRREFFTLLYKLAADYNQTWPGHGAPATSKRYGVIPYLLLDRKIK